MTVCSVTGRRCRCDIGGFGHLGVQFAPKRGCRTVAIARGSDKDRLARLLGGQHWIDNTGKKLSSKLTKLGGPK